MSPAWKPVAAAAATLTALTIVMLWSWNTLVPLTGAPEAQLKHVLAALLLLGLARRCLAGPRRRYRCHRHG